MEINSDDLKTFITVIDSGTLSAASVHLGQTTSGVSRALARLEDKLATSLLTRTTRRMELTEEGQLFLEQARAILGAMEEAEESIRIRQQRPAGRLCLSADSAFLLHCVLPHLAEFRSRYPDIRLELNSSDQATEVLEQRTDLAIRIGLPDDASQHAEVLASSPLQVLASPDYLQAYGTPHTPEQLSAHTLIGDGQSAAEQHWPLRHLGGNSLPIVPAIAASSVETRRQLALRGQGIACLAEYLSTADVAAGRLVPLLRDADAGQTQQICAVYLRNTRLAQRIQCFLEFLREKL